MVGSISHLPPGQGESISNNPYGDVNNDTISEIIIGRFPCTTAYECSTMVEKTFKYERIPFLNDTFWFKRATTIRQDPAGIYHTPGVNFVCSLMVNFGNFQRDDIDTFMTGSHDSTNVINALNQGRSYLLYTGHGHTTRWSDPFNVSPEGLNNGSKLPIVVVWCCYGGLLGNLGERWLKAKRNDSLTGSVVYIGTSQVGQAKYRNHIARNIFRAIFQYQKTTIGMAFQEGKDSLWAFHISNPDTCPPESVFKYYCDFNLLGDPELNLWTAVPKPMLVSHEREIPTGQQSFAVTVSDLNGPIQNALVCVMMPNDTTVYKYDYTNSNGIINLPIYLSQTDWLYVTVTARNHIPYEDSCQVFPVSAQATYPNQGKHLIRKPNSSELHRVFETDDKVFYQMSSNWGQNWSTSTYLGDGNYPCISIGPIGGTPWVLWGSSRPYGPFYSAVKRTDGSWNIREIFPIGEELISNPSMALATIQNEQGDLAYCVFRTHNRILFGAYDTLKDYCVGLIDDYDPCLAPSISITPADLLHIVWQRDISEEGKIFYTTSEKVHPNDIRQDIPPNLLGTHRISQPAWPQTEPASNPSVEAYGEYVYAAWRGPNEQGNPEFGDIWRRARWLPYEDPSRWEPPENKSETRDNESNYPVMSTDFVRVWHESIADNNWDIWARFEPEDSAQPIFQTSSPSKYPHIAGYWDPNPPVPPTYCVNTIWTEEIAPEIYEVRFDCYRYVYNPDPEEKASLYYAVEIGDNTPSSYCTQRDGYLSYGQYKIDYGQQKLKYKLPYLHPSYYYDLRAIVYQQGQNSYSQNFDIDSIYSTTLTFTSNRPETVWIRIPQQAYKYDTKVKQEIKKILGNRAVVTDLRLYQREEFTSGGGTGQQSITNTLIQLPILYQSYPNPFKSRTVIRYILPTECNVSLSIYDISGRLVKTLVNQNQTAGIYTINLDGKDGKGNTLSQGIYFYRLKTDNFSDTKRIVFIK